MNKEEFILELENLGINLSEQQLSQFDTYYRLLISWNEKINLTSITEENSVYLKHFYDCSTIVKIIDLNNVENLCDIGTGAGFPGIVIKILFPNLKVTLVDALEKRCKFLSDVIEKLNLDNIFVHHRRAEEFCINHTEEYDVVTSRAVASLRVLLELSAQLVKVNGYIIALKANVEDEIKESQTALGLLNLKLVNKKQFTLPHEESNRNILLIEKKGKTNSKYPRKFSEIKKKPL